MDLPTLFWEFLKAGLLSFGGLGNLPILLDSLVTYHGWASEATFSEALAVGRISPGPNGLYVVALGYLLAGVPGVLITTLAAIIPSLLVLPLSLAYNRVAGHPRVAGMMRMIVFAVAGSLGLTGIQLVRSSITAPIDLAIAVAAPAIVLLRPRWNPVYVLVVAGIVGLAVHW